MILRIPVANTIGVCSKCWALATPHNSGGLLQTPYLRVSYCTHNDAPGDRIQSPLLVRDRFEVDYATHEVTGARVERAPWGSLFEWLWVVETTQVEAPS